MSLAMKTIIASVRDAAELETAIVAQTREPDGGLIVMPDTFMTVQRAKITALAAQYGLPAVYHSVSSPQTADCCRTGMIPPTIIGARQPTPIASFRA